MRDGRFVDCVDFGICVIYSSTPHCGTCHSANWSMLGDPRAATFRLVLAAAVLTWRRCAGPILKAANRCNNLAQEVCEVAVSATPELPSPHQAMGSLATADMRELVASSRLHLHNWRASAPRGCAPRRGAQLARGPCRPLSPSPSAPTTAFRPAGQAGVVAASNRPDDERGK